MKTRTHVRRHIRRIHGKKVGVVKHTRVLHKNLSYKQLKRKGSRIQPYADTDRDGKVNRFDCRPLNPQKQDNEVDSIAAKELGQYILSENGCFQKHLPIIQNLSKKKKMGVYQHNKAVMLFMYLVENAAKKYTKENCSMGDKWYGIFNVPTRKVVAEELTRYFEREYALGNYKNI